jgi:chaperonin GroES
MSFHPLHDHVLVRRSAARDETAGGIIIPETAKEKPQEGDIVAIRDGLRDEDGILHPLDVKAGDHILFSQWPAVR